jgi:hypothetical protein
VWVVVDETPDWPGLTDAWMAAFGPEVQPPDDTVFELAAARTTRFHTLDDEEQAGTELLAAPAVVRVSAILDALGSEPEILAISCHGAESDVFAPYRRSWATAKGLARWKTLRLVDPDPDEIELTEDLFIERLSRGSEAFAALVRDIARVRRDVRLLAPRDFRWAARPYSGGIDVIAPSRDAILDLRWEFADWLPPATTRTTERLAWAFIDGLETIDQHFRTTSSGDLITALGELVGAVNRRSLQPKGTWNDVAYDKHGSGARLTLGEHHIDIDTPTETTAADQVEVDPWKVALCAISHGHRVIPADVRDVLREASRQHRLDVRDDHFMWPPR